MIMVGSNGAENLTVVHGIGVRQRCLSGRSPSLTNADLTAGSVARFHRSGPLPCGSCPPHQMVGGARPIRVLTDVYFNCMIKTNV
jgi:hypothetical protein